MYRTYYSTLTSKGQTTIPREVRELLGLQPKDKVAFHVRDETVLLEGISLDLERVFGSVKQVTDVEQGDFGEIIDEAWRQAAAERVRRMKEQ